MALELSFLCCIYNQEWKSKVIKNEKNDGDDDDNLLGSVSLPRSKTFCKCKSVVHWFFGLIQKAHWNIMRLWTQVFRLIGLLVSMVFWFTSFSGFLVSWFISFSGFSGFLVHCFFFHWCTQQILDVVPSKNVFICFCYISLHLHKIWYQQGTGTNILH